LSIHRAKLRVTCELEVPQYQKGKGIEIELVADDKPLGELHIYGAHVYFRPFRKSKWKSWSFTEFAKLLSE